MQKIIFLKKLKSNPSKKRGDSQFIQKSFYAKILHEKRQKIMKSSRLYKRLKNAKIKKLKILQKITLLHLKNVGIPSLFKKIMQKIAKNHTKNVYLLNKEKRGESQCLKN